MSDYESRLPEWQRWLNQFCENWIFAFLVAMAIRHFCIEAFRIPTASMEPMLYGDPGILKGDQVVVDKLTPRFIGYSRWDVTVFQFPRPELENGDDAKPALNASGERIDSPLLNPLFCRSFVKRMLALPGDTFYFSGGDLHLKQADGSFAIARKPAAVQEAVWQDIYLHGDQPGYVPWAGAQGAEVKATASGLEFTLPGGQGAVNFTQPLRNLYLKPGVVRALPLPRLSLTDGALVELSMTKPEFHIAGRKGNLWDLDNWEIQRLSTKDLDRGYSERNLNDVMNEWVGDVRLSGEITGLTGTPAISFMQGTPGLAESHGYTWQLSATGWQFSGDGHVLAQGQESVSGKNFSLAHLDGQFVITINHQEVARVDVPDSDSNKQRVQLAVTGTGVLACAGLKLQRDLYYCNHGFLRNETAQWKNFSAGSGAADALTANKSAENLRVMEQVRAQMRGKDTLTMNEKQDRWGYSPETAITVPANAYLLMGDNSPFSWDGRFWGWVPGENLRGRALAVLFPPPRWRIVR